MKKICVLVAFLLIAQYSNAQLAVIVDTLNGWLTVGVQEEEIISQLGLPDSQTEPEVWEFTGHKYYYLHYDNLGLNVLIEDDTRCASVYAIEVYSKSQFSTSRDVSVGDSRKYVCKQYGDLENFHEVKDVIILNTIYEGTCFVFQDDILVKIHLGPLAD